MPMDRSKYPPDWKAISLRIRERAGWRCEQCGIAQGEPTKSGGPVVLTVAHLNHDTTDNRDENLRAWCQACHIRYDAAHHAENARATRTRKRIAAAESAGQAMFFQEEPMPTNDDQPIITGERVTAEFAALKSPIAWERTTPAGRQFYAHIDGVTISLGADDDDPLTLTDATPDVLTALGFTPCTDPAVLEAVGRFLLLVGEGGQA